MSLKVWLPLDGDTKNYGTVQDTINWTTAATYNNNGKMGKALATGGATMPAAMTAKVLNNHAVTIACWIYVNADAGDSTNRAMIFGNSSMNTLGGRQFSIFRYPNADDIHLSWQSYSGGTYTQVLTFVQSGVLTARAWNHVCLTYQNPTATLYVNGVKINSWSGVAMNASSFAYDTNLIWNSTSHYINDFRIYDNCLSEKEVKELAQGLALHYKLDDVCGYNLLKNTPKIYAPSTYEAYNLELTENMVAGETYTLQFWDVNVSHTGKTDSTLGLSVYWGGGYVNIHTWNGVLTNGHIDYLEYTFTITSSQASGNGATNAWLAIYNSVPHADGTRNMSIGAWRLVKGSVAPRGWEPQNNTLTLVDSSGYKRDASLITHGPFYIENGGPRYNRSIRFSGNNTASGNSYAYSGPIPWFTFDKCTISAWVKPTQTLSGWNGSVGLEADEGNTYKGLSIEPYSNTFYTVVVNGNYTLINSGKSLPINEWHHCAVTLDGTTLKQYYDGALVNQTTISWGSATVHSSMRFAVAVDFPGADECFNGNISDVRFYTTALSASDILELYQTPINIDDKGNLHSLSVDEDASISACSNGSFISACHNELLIEPDGAIFEHIFHHNNPSKNLFASTDTFTTGVYKNEDTWANFQVFNSLTSWELLAIQTQTTSSAAEKWRWIQTVNPNVAAFGDVDAADITKVSGYSTWSSSYGGLCTGNSNNAKYTQNNSVSGNWFGATGSWTAFQGGIPGYMGKLVTTGCMDLYVKVGNIKSSLYRNQVDTFNTLIEK